MDADQLARIGDERWDAHRREHASHDVAHQREHLDQVSRVEAAAEALDLRLAAMNEWRAQLNSERAEYVTRRELSEVRDAMHHIETVVVTRDELDSRFTTLGDRIGATELSQRGVVTTEQFAEHQQRMAADGAVERRYRATLGMAVGTALLAAFVAVALALLS